jgi:hypothetical protein
MKGRKGILLLASVMALACSAAATATASASPAWKFNGSELTGSETVLGAAVNSSMTIPGVTTECKHFLYNMKISNSGAKGKGEITELPLFECSTQTEFCTVSSIEAKKLPWPTHLTTIGGKNYLIVEKIEVSVLYGGAFCVYAGIPMTVSGSAGGLVDNSTETATFNNASAIATGSGLWVGFTWVEWNGVFPTEAFGAHREQKIEVG